MHRVLMVGVLVVLVAGTPMAVAASTAPESGTQQGFDREEFTIHVHENGTARWTFSYERVLANQSERRQFETYAERFDENETQSYRNFVTRANALTSAGADETGREMDAAGFSKDAYVRRGLNDVGVVEMSFLWTGFAVEAEEGLVVGDVFEGGLTLSADQRLVVTWDDSLTPTTVEPSPQQGVEETGDTLLWHGESGGTQFLDQQPRVVFSPVDQADPGAGATTTDGTTEDSGAGGIGGGEETPPGGEGEAGDLVVWPFAFGAIVLVALGSLAFRHGYLDDETPNGGGTDGETSSPESTPEPAPEPEPAVTDEELLSDEDRVRSLLAENGGRMKQVNIVDETGWSKSKVSMLLSEMEEDEEIHKLRVGRENIISRSGDEPDATRSTFDDE
ncbi:helix-turn-helix transcriptional regulator [Halomarina oriensis]|uniref:Helix-turn-helix domain-containing protein n=1 Tax=Halomarina oriensis TaxID=671145 RepID=A0A6B0GV03_9EURY|nr:hypothetical protein [Halomarina oriensis]MWG36403.1 hypothetical protein [Halomarina oriensis]